MPAKKTRKLSKAKIPMERKAARPSKTQVAKKSDPLLGRNKRRRKVAKSAKGAAN